MNKKLPKDIYKLLVNKLKYVQKDMKAIEDEIHCSTQDCNSFIKSKNKTSDNVASMAIKLADNTYYQELKMWKNCRDELLVMYKGHKAKYEFLKRRYIDCKLKNYQTNDRYKIKDKYVIIDLEMEGYNYSERTWKYWKYDIIYNFYLLVKQRNLIKNEKNL